MLSRMKMASAFLLLALILSFVPAESGVGHASAASCYSAQFIADVNVPDGESHAPGTVFTKTWRLQNTGTCAWSDVSLIFDNGEKMGASVPAALSTTVAPTKQVDISVNLTAPSAPGTYKGSYKLQSTAGGVFGIASTTANQTFWVEINVNSSSGTGYDFFAEAAKATWSSGAGAVTVPGTDALTFPGTDGNASGFAISGSNWKFEDSNNISSPSAILVSPKNITDGYIQGVYPSFKVQSGDFFQAKIGCEFGATTCYVEYRLKYQIDGSTDVKTFWKEPPFREKYEGLTYPVKLDLKSLAGQSVKFILVVSAFGSPTGDRALWGNPRITRSGGTISPTITGTPPTSTPTVTGTPPTSTPGTTTACIDRALFVKDVNYPDGTTLAPGQSFTKTWEVKNMGTNTWTTAYKLVFDSVTKDSNKMNGIDPVPFSKSVAPGDILDISIPLTAPSTAGTYTGYWKFKNNSDAAFGLVPFGDISKGCQKSFWVTIKVAGTPTPATNTPITPTATNTPITPTATNTPITPAP